ncbi:hypothetical protein [Pseudonocardia acaciae]|uniref:hypothetical protein n=1 Tax=Pseudonocardia acaciae TaxID=551276 RepID=UPI000564453C|nr:hypothetical protein [Pseudonocardia acaciae]
MCANRVYVHVGAPKTGTTFVQEVLWANRDALRRSGVLYPGLSKDAQFHAVMDLRKAHYQEHANPAVAGAWRRLADQARSWRGDVVLSHELFSMLDQREVRAALADLAWADVHVVLTARDLARQVPAVWQEDVKNRQTLTFAEFARELSAPGERPHYLVDLFWRLQDIPRVLDAWAESAGRVHLVTVPPPGSRPSELWTRFSRAIDIAPDTCDIDLVDKANHSMGIVETNVVRRLNIAMADGLDWPSYDELVKDYLAVTVLARRESSVPLRLPATDQEWVTRRSKEMVDTLRERDYPVIGDLNDLIPAAPDPEHRHPDDATDAELLDAAIHALAGMLRWSADHTPPKQPGWRRTAVELSQRNAALGQLRRRYLVAKARRRGGR